MSSSYTLSGISFYTSSFSSFPVVDYDSKLVVSAPTNGGYVQYSVEETAGGPAFDFSGNTTNVELTAFSFFNDVSITLDRGNGIVMQIPWRGSTTDVLAVLHPFGAVSPTYTVSFFPLGGASTEHIDTINELLPLLQGFEDYTVIDSGQFAPDQPILLSEIALISATEIPKPDGLVVAGTDANDLLFGDAGDDRLMGNSGQDTLNGGDGADTLNGGAGDDFIYGGSSADDERDLIYAGAGHDRVEGGYGNDLIYGMAGNDTLAGGFGADELQGQDGDDVITGSAYADLIFGGAGDDFINGGFGHDLINGGAGADRFYHLGIAGHGSDWVQDYNAAEGDVLLFGNASAAADDFQINLAHTASATGERSGDDDVQEAFVIYRPTGQIIWALVDGAGQDEINLRIGDELFDLLG